MMDTRLYHLDLIRLAAFILLICCHTCDPFNAAATYGAGIATYEYTLWGSIYGALVRPCVPLFVMLTGALLLKQKGVSSAAPSIDMKAFYRKRIPRVLLPFVIWSAVYYVWPWLVGLAGYGEATVAMFFPWAETMSCDWAPAAERLLGRRAGRVLLG